MIKLSKNTKFITDDCKKESLEEIQSFRYQNASSQI